MRITTCTKHTDPSSWPVSIDPPFAQNVRNHLDKKYPGADFLSTYEAGFCGFWPHQQLVGIKNIEVQAPIVQTTDKDRKQKEDRWNARKLANALKYGSIEGIYVPSEQALTERAVVRERDSTTC